MSTKSIRAGCGIQAVASSLSSTRDAVAAARAALDDVTFQHVIAFFSTDHDPELVTDALSQSFPGTPVSGCSTAGEFGPLGMMRGGLVLIAFPEIGFRILSEAIPDLETAGVSSASEIARRLRVQMIGGTRRAPDNVFALVLVDGRSNKEETLTAALHWSLDDIELVGGSADDGLAFRSGTLLHRGKLLSRGAILFVIESDTRFEIFKTQNFEPTPMKLVVTSADTENRVVYELNAEPAAREYAAAIGLVPENLRAFSFASHPLVVKIGGDYYCRSIRQMNPDGSLSFFCAIDEGLVFTVAKPCDLLNSTLKSLEAIDSHLGGTDFVIGFDCVLRRLDAESRQIRHLMENTYRRFGVTGFHTYGEQYNAMHLNQTLTGIAFARSREEARTE